MNCSTPGLLVHHQLPEFTQTHVCQVGDAIQPSHPLSSPFPPAPNPSQPQGASRAAPGKSGLHAHGEGELVITLDSWEAARFSRGFEEGLSRSFLGCGGKPLFPSTSAADLRELPTVPLRGEGCCVVGRASRDSAGFGAMEEGLISRGGRNLRLPLGFGLRLHGPCSVGTGESCLVLSEEWNSGCLSSCSGSLRTLVELCVDPAGFSG